MPSHEEHCEDSLRRYGKRFDELHRWMDEPSVIMGSKHRTYRHDPYKTPQEAKLLFGPLADQACLDHIRLDQQESKRKGIGKMRIPIRETRQNKLQDSLRYGFGALMFFIIGFLLISQPYSSWGSIVCFFISFLLFLAFLGSLSEKNGKTLTTEMKGKTISSLETNEKKSVKGDALKRYVSGDLDKIGIFDVTIMATCTKCGEEFDAKLKTCPRCRGMTFCSNCGEWYEGESCSKCKATTTCLHCGLEYDAAQGICPRCGVAIGYTDYEEG